MQDVKGKLDQVEKALESKSKELVATPRGDRTRRQQLDHERQELVGAREKLEKQRIALHEKQARLMQGRDNAGLTTTEERRFIQNNYFQQF